MEIIKTWKIVSRLCAPPNSSKQFKKTLRRFCQKSQTKKKIKEVIVVGDVNAYLDNSNEKPFKELVALNYFLQTVKGPTCITDTSTTLIDVIY